MSYLKNLHFDSMVIFGFCLAGLSMRPVMLIGGTMQLARFTPIFPLVIKNALLKLKSNDRKEVLVSQALLAQTLLASFMGVLWIVFSPAMSQ